MKRVCDGYVDCLDGSDEDIQNCTKRFRCRANNGTKVMYTYSQHRVLWTLSLEGSHKKGVHGVHVIVNAYLYNHLFVPTFNWKKSLCCQIKIVLQRKLVAACMISTQGIRLFISALFDFAWKTPLCLKKKINSRRMQTWGLCKNYNKNIDRRHFTIR